jgi:hypothetical protein
VFRRRLQLVTSRILFRNTIAATGIGYTLPHFLLLVLLLPPLSLTNFVSGLFPFRFNLKNVNVHDSRQVCLERRSTLPKVATYTGQHEHIKYADILSCVELDSYPQSTSEDTSYREAHHHRDRIHLILILNNKS